METELSKPAYFLWGKCSCPFIEGNKGDGVRLAAGLQLGLMGWDDQQCSSLGLTGFLTRETKRPCGTGARGATGDWYQFPSGGKKYLSVQTGNYVPLRVRPVSGSDVEKSSQEWRFSSSLDKNRIISIPKFSKAAFSRLCLCSLTALHNKKNIRT